MTDTGSQSNNVLWNCEYKKAEFKIVSCKNIRDAPPRITVTSRN